MKKQDDKIKQDFYALLEKPGKDENDIQKFLECNSELIPLPFLLGHQLHFNCIISKFKLGNEFVTDFAYLTKCSDYWEFVLIELEEADKKIFTKNQEKICFTADFNNSYDQLTSWKAYVDQNKNAILEKIEKLRVPLGENPIRFKYVLIIGRNNEKQNFEKRTKMFAQRCSEDTKIMTYDSIISSYEYRPYSTPKLILAPWKDKGFRIKNVPTVVDTNIFAHMTTEYLKVDKAEVEQLKKQDYQIDAWIEGSMLTINCKYDF